MRFLEGGMDEPLTGDSRTNVFYFKQVSRSMFWTPESLHVTTMQVDKKKEKKVRCAEVEWEYLL